MRRSPWITSLARTALAARRTRPWPMRASGSRWRLLLVLLAALALACRGEIDPITGQQSPTAGYPNYGPAPGAGAAKGARASSQRRDKMSGRSQAQRGKRRLLAAMFGDDGDGGPKAGCVLARRSPARRHTDPATDPAPPLPRSPTTTAPSSRCRFDLPKLALAETLIGVFAIMICGLLFSGAF